MRVPLADSTFTPEELDFAAHVLKYEPLTMGVYCESFERQFAGYIGRRHAIYVNSGSSANLLAFFCLANKDRQPRDKRSSIARRREDLSQGEIIVPALTWSTSVWPIVQAGYLPHFIDSDPRTLQLDLDQLEMAINDHTVAICVPHIMGNAVNIQLVQALCQQHGLWLIEDCCEALGVKFRGALVGTCSDMATYSFYFSHHITTIEGGMIVTDDDELADMLRAMRSHGWIRQMRDTERFTRFRPGLDPRYLFATTGFNVRSTEINAVLGISQLRKIDKLNAARNNVATVLKQGLHSALSRYAITCMEITEGTEAAWFGFPILCARPSQRAAFQTHLEANGIETRPIVCGNLCRHPAMINVAHRGAQDLRGCDEVMENGLYMGIHPGMDNPETLAYVLKAFDKFSVSISD